ncbi:zinc ribbon domain-containing protein [Synechococcus sp. H60.2]|uniref:zinc ribbon domain-containing protein n=1 Tax=Synechococcus sp. H60.2 TaxID=2964518 RepID=UPI0039C4AA4D
MRQFVQYKAMRVGVEVVGVPPAYSSQTCHQCLWLGQREGDTDFNGATRVSGTESL